MANVELEAFTALADMLRATSKEAIGEAEMAAAKVFRSAARAAAPRDTGTLARSVQIVEGKQVGRLYADMNIGVRQRLFVGATKPKGFYGFFVEKGHKTPIGKAQIFYARAGSLARAARAQGLPGRPFESRRLKRYTGAAAHSQQGLTESRIVPAHPWFQPSILRAEAQATAAAEAAFNRKMAELNNRK